MIAEKRYSSEDQDSLSGIRDLAGADSGGELSYGWQACQRHRCTDEKQQMAKHFVDHEFLVRSRHSPEASRERVASIFANSGTTPATVVSAAIDWLVNEWKEFKEPFTVSWFTPGAHAIGIIRDFRVRHPQFRSITDLFLIPGPVDPEVEAVVGNVPAEFMEKLKIGFAYALLSAFSFDMRTGNAYFQFEREIAPQKACAQLYAERKYLFLDSEKFRTQGHFAYNIRDLVKSSREVTIYTVSTTKNDMIVDQFKRLASKHIPKTREEEGRFERRILRLIVLGRTMPRLEEWHGYFDMESDQ